MSEYENRIYELLTSSEDKFKSSFEIANRFDKVKWKLIKDFWVSVKEELEKLIEENNEDFSVELDSDILRQYSKCYVYLDNNINTRILYQNLAEDQCIGIWVDAFKVDQEKVNNYTRATGVDIQNLSTNTWWVSLKYISEDFRDLDSLTLILPEYSLAKSKIKAKELFDYALVNKEHLRGIAANCFNKNEEIGKIL
jgi:hypothetical protein